MRNRLLQAVPALLLACSDSSAPPNDGPLVVRVTTVGEDKDLNGYRLLFDGEEPGMLIPTSGEVTRYLTVGPHVVEIRDLHANCDASGGTSRSVTVTEVDVTEVEFEVSCYATGIKFITLTQGIEFDPNGYTVRIPGHPARTVPVNGSLTVGRLTPGTYEVVIDWLADNCSLDGEAHRQAQVVNRQVTDLEFAFTCVAATGVLEVATLTTGTDVDRAGYLVTVGSSWQRSARVNEPSVWFDGLPPGTHQVALTQVASNCTVAGENPKPALITVTGQFTRDTTRLSFEVTCARTPMIAFSRERSILLAHPDGTEAFVLATDGVSPSWSPDGRDVVFGRLACYYEYYYCYPTGLSRVSVESLAITDLTVTLDADPAWSPDGTRIAFERHGQLRLLELQNSTETILDAHVLLAMHPTWSPDGTRLAFTCMVENQNFDICTINVDGTGVQRLTHSLEFDHEPSWSPGGDRIAFTTSQAGATWIATIPLVGGEVAFITPGRLADWAGDDTRLVFLDDSGLLTLINLDGSDRVGLLERSEWKPAWRP